MKASEVYVIVCAVAFGIALSNLFYMVFK